MDTVKIISKIRLEISKYFKANNKTYAIFGKSMGIDSSLVAGLLSNVPDVKPVGVINPIKSDPDDEKIAKIVLKYFKIPFIKINLTKEYERLADKLYLDDNLINQVNEIKGRQDYKVKNNVLLETKSFALANIKLRLRMITLYHIAKIMDGIVIGTGNFSEHMTGFWTLHGDVGDFCPIMNLYKTEVYDLAKKLKVPSESINAIPSDGAGFTKKGTDEDQLGLTYDKLDMVIKDYLTGNTKNQILNKFNFEKSKTNKALAKIINFKYKRKLPITISRQKLGLD
ncbi:NAD(+) synthase [Patescibacteria group bacterium]